MINHVHPPTNVLASAHGRRIAWRGTCYASVHDVIMPHPTPPHPRAMCKRVSSVVSVAVHVGSKCTWTSHSVAWYMLRKRTWRYHAPPHPTPPQTRSRKNAVFARKNAKKAEISCCLASVKMRVYRPTEPPTNTGHCSISGRIDNGIHIVRL